jgi:acyl carrier protein
VTRDEIFSQVRDLLAKSFEIDPAVIKPESLLFQELELDSIDAIDMVVQLQEWTGRYVPEESLRGIRTVDDVVSLVESHLAAGADKSGAGADKPGAGAVTPGAGAVTKGASATMAAQPAVGVAAAPKGGPDDGSG